MPSDDKKIYDSEKTLIFHIHSFFCDNFYYFAVYLEKCILCVFAHTICNSYDWQKKGIYSSILKC